MKKPMELEDVVKSVQEVAADYKQLHERNKEVTGENKQLTDTCEMLKTEKTQLTQVNQTLKSRSDNLATTNFKLNQKVAKLTTENEKLVTGNEKLATENDRLATENENCSNENKKLTSKSVRLAGVNKQLQLDARKKDHELGSIRSKIVNQNRLDNDLRLWAQSADRGSADNAPIDIPGRDQRANKTQATREGPTLSSSQNSTVAQDTQVDPESSEMLTNAEKRAACKSRQVDLLRTCIRNLPWLSPDEDIREVLPFAHRPSGEYPHHENSYDGPERMICGFENWGYQFVIGLRSLLESTQNMSRSEFYSLIHEAVEKRRSRKYASWDQDLMVEDIRELMAQITGIPPGKRYERDEDDDWDDGDGTVNYIRRPFRPGNLKDYEAWTESHQTSDDETDGDVTEDDDDL